MNKILLISSFGFILFLIFKLRINKKKKISREFIQTYKFPQQVLYNFREQYPNLSFIEEQKVIKSLKMFFIAKTYSNKPILMTSKVADDLWHCFLKDYVNYVIFCKQAFGKILNHYPIDKLSAPKSIKDIVKFPDKIVESYSTVKKAQINTSPENTIPLIFLLDYQLNILDGYQYDEKAISRLEQQVEEMQSDSESSDSSDDSSDCSSCSSCGGD